MATVGITHGNLVIPRGIYGLAGFSPRQSALFMPLDRIVVRVCLFATLAVVSARLSASLVAVTPNLQAVAVLVETGLSATMARAGEIQAAMAQTPGGGLAASMTEVLPPPTLAARMTQVMPRLGSASLVAVTPDLQASMVEVPAGKLGASLAEVTPSGLSATLADQTSGLSATMEEC